MLHRTKSSRSQTRRRSTHFPNATKTTSTTTTTAAAANSTAAQHLKALDRRYSDDDSSQSSLAVAPVFASVHRTRQAGISAIKRDGIPITTKTTTAIAITTLNLMNSHGQQQDQPQQNHQQRPSYQQYQVQRRQQQLQQQQQPQSQKLLYENEKRTMKFYRHEASTQQEQQTQQQREQQHLHQNQIAKQHLSSLATKTIGSVPIGHGSESASPSAEAAAGAQAATVTIAGNGKPSIVQQQSFWQMNQSLEFQSVENNHHQQQHQQQQQKQQQQRQQTQMRQRYEMASISAATTCTIKATAIQISRIHYQQQQQLQQQHNNFNQISTTTPHSLNDIYQKHLLSQTTFQEIEQYRQQQQQQRVPYDSPNRHALVAGASPSGVRDFNINDLSENACVQQQNHQQQIHHQQHTSRPQKPVHFLKLPPPPTTPAPTVIPLLTPKPPSPDQYHYPQQQQLLPASKCTTFLPPQPPSSPTSLNHVYETIAERPSLPKAPTSLPPSPPPRPPLTRHISSGVVPEEEIKNAAPPPPPPGRQTKLRVWAIGAGGVATESSARLTKSNHRKTFYMTATTASLTPTAACVAQYDVDDRNTINAINNIIATTTNKNTQPMKNVEKIGKDESYCVAVGNNQRRQLPIQPAEATLTPPAYVEPPPAHKTEHKKQLQQQQRSFKKHYYNIHQRTRADGEQKSQQLKEYQRQQQQQIKRQKEQTKQGQEQVDSSLHTTSECELALEAKIAAKQQMLITTTTTTTTTIGEAVPCSSCLTGPATTTPSISVEEQLHLAGLLRNNNNNNSNNNSCNNNTNCNNGDTNNTVNNPHYNKNKSVVCGVLPIVVEEESQSGDDFKEVAALVGARKSAVGEIPAPLVPVTAAAADVVPVEAIAGDNIASSSVKVLDNQPTALVENAVGTARLPYRHGKIEVSLETAQAMAAAAYYARAAQKLAQGGSTKSTRISDMNNSTTPRNGGFCGALQRAPPPMPPGLARRLANKENYGVGKVKVMLRVTDARSDSDSPHFMAVDKKKRQVTLTDPTALSTVPASTSQERGPMVAAPKMFAFDSLFTADDQQLDVCSSALSEVIPAVLEGSDGCLMTIGYPSSGQSKTMLGSVNPPSDLGAIPCAISWLYKGINERRQKSGARFSVRVSALGVSATKPDSSSKDLLAAHATDSDDSPGVYLRDDFLGGPTELRAPTAERAALFLDAALAGRPQSGLEPALIFTLHVYQYSLSRKGGVAGGRSRLHLIDLGGCANRNGGLPLSGIGNILLAILSGQRHPPNKDHALTPLLKDCLAPLTCHVAIMAHVMHIQSHSDALTTIQLASRIHRMRRRKHRFPMQSDKTAAGLTAVVTGGHQSTGSSAGSGADPSSSELSADTVIYMGPSDEATDGEHPPVYLPSLGSADNRGVMSKALKGSGIEKQQPPLTKPPGAAKKVASQKVPQSPVATKSTNSLKRGHANSPTHQQQLQQPQQNIVADQPPQYFSPTHSVITLPHSASSPKIIASSLRHPNVAVMSSKGSNMASPKGSPLRRPGVGIAAADQQAMVPAECPGSPMRKITEEQWIDGPRVSRAKVAEARHLLREVNHVKQCETWIDGPKSQSSRSLTVGNLPNTTSQSQGYGFMDSHKKTMIRQWVENQTSQVFQSSSATCSPTHHGRVGHQASHTRNSTHHIMQLKQKSLDTTTDDFFVPASQTLQTHQLLADQQSMRSSQQELVNPIFTGLSTALSTTNASAPPEIRDGHYGRQNEQQQQQQMRQIQQHRHNPISMINLCKDETDLHSERSLFSHHVAYGAISQSLPASETGHQCERGLGEFDEDQDSGPSEVPPALPLIEPLGSREISHESLHRILSRHVSRESLFQQQQQQQHQQQEQRRRDEFQQQHSRTPSHHFSQQSMSDCGLQVTEEEIARTMGSEHPLSVLSHCDNMSIVSSFNMAGDAFSDCAMGERTRNQFDQLARLREIFTSQLAMAEVTPVFRSGCDLGSVFSEPAYRFNTGPGSVCSEPPYRPPSPIQPSRCPSNGSLPSLNGIMQIAGMEQYASLRHPDGASDPNLPKLEKPFAHETDDLNELDEKVALLSPSKRPSFDHEVHEAPEQKHHIVGAPPIAHTTQTQLPLLPLNTSSEAYDSGHDSSTPRTSKHSGISRRAESGYHSVATARDSDESSFTSGISKEHNRIIMVQKKRRQEKGLCTWLMNPFTCTYPETEGEISDF